MQLTIAAPAVESLRSHLDGREGPLFLDRSGNPLRRRGAARRLERLVKIAGVNPRITPHGVRRSAATVALDEGEDVRRVQRMLGHRSIETTMIYDQSRQDVDRSPTHALAAALESFSRTEGTHGPAI